MSYIGDITEDAPVQITFNTNAADGTPTTLSGSPAVAVYKQGSTTESSTGVSVTVDYDSRTGLNIVVIDTSADAFYETGKDYAVILTAGTVDSVSVAGVQIGSFSIQNRPATSAPSAADIADAVWDEALADHDDTGSAGAGLAAASSAGDPWATLLPGAYTSGQAGHIIGTYLDAAITSRSSHTVANVASLILATPANKLVTDGSGRVTVGTNADKSGYALTVTPPTAGQIADAVWDEALSGHVATGTAGEALGAIDLSDIALQVWDTALEDIVADASMGLFVLGKLGLITAEGIVMASIVSTGDVISIWQGRSRTITFVIPQASINLAGHTAKFGITKIITETGTAALEVIGTLTEVGADYHLTFELSTAQTAALAKSPAPAHPYRITTAESYSYTWSISATDGAGSCPQLAEGMVTVKASDTTCSTS